jgi:hypothetical protein
MSLGIPVKAENERSPDPCCDNRVELAFSDPLRQVEWIALLELQRLFEEICEYDEISAGTFEDWLNNSEINCNERKQA